MPTSQVYWRIISHFQASSDLFPYTKFRNVRSSAQWTSNPVVADSSRIHSSSCSSALQITKSSASVVQSTTRIVSTCLSETYPLHLPVPSEIQQARRFHGIHLVLWSWGFRLQMRRRIFYSMDFCTKKALCECTSPARLTVLQASSSFFSNSWNSSPNSAESIRWLTVWALKFLISCNLRKLQPWRLNSSAYRPVNVRPTLRRQRNSIWKTRYEISPT